MRRKRNRETCQIDTEFNTPFLVVLVEGEKRRFCHAHNWSTVFSSALDGGAHAQQRIRELLVP